MKFRNIFFLLYLLIFTSCASTNHPYVPVGYEASFFDHKGESKLSGNLMPFNLVKASYWRSLTNHLGINGTYAGSRKVYAPSITGVLFKSTKYLKYEAGVGFQFQRNVGKTYQLPYTISLFSSFGPYITEQYDMNYWSSFFCSSFSVNVGERAYTGFSLRASINYNDHYHYKFALEPYGTEKGTPYDEEIFNTKIPIFYCIEPAVFIKLANVKMQFGMNFLYGGVRHNYAFFHGNTFVPNFNPQYPPNTPMSKMHPVINPFTCSLGLTLPSDLFRKKKEAK